MATPYGRESYGLATPGTIRGIATPDVGSTRLQSQTPTYGGTTWSESKGLKTHVGSANATVKRESVELRRQLATLTKQHDKAIKASADFREENTRMRKICELNARELATARRHLERLGAEKSHIEAAEATDKSYVRKLEAKVAAGIGSVAQEEKLIQLRQKLKETQQELEQCKADLNAENMEGGQAQAEIKALQHALNLRVEELGAGGGEDVHSKLLYAVGRGREEGVALAVQLAERTEGMRKAESECAELKAQVEELAYVKEANGQELLQLERTLAALRAEAGGAGERCGVLEAQLRDADEARALLEAELDHMRQDLAQERERTQALANALAASESAAAVEAEAMRGEMRATLEKEKSQAVADRIKSEHRIEEEQKRSSEILQQLEGERRDRQKIIDGYASEVTTERAKSAATVRAAEAAAAAAAAREREVVDEVQNLYCEIEAFTEVNERLQGQLSDAHTGAHTEGLRVENLQQQVATLEAQLSVLRSENHSASSTLKGRMESNLAELQGVMSERDRLRAALNEAMSKCASLSTTEDALRAEVAQLRELTDNLTRSKELLQRTLMDQVSQAKKELETQTRVRRELEVTVKRQRDGASRLEHQVEQERRATAALTRHYEASSSHTAAMEDILLPRRSPPVTRSPAVSRSHGFTSSAAAAPPPRAQSPHTSPVLRGLVSGEGMGPAPASFLLGGVAGTAPPPSSLRAGASPAGYKPAGASPPSYLQAGGGHGAEGLPDMYSSGVASMLGENKRLLAGGTGAAGAGARGARGGAGSKPAAAAPTLDELAAASGPFGLSEMYSDHGSGPVEMM